MEDLLNQVLKTHNATVAGLEVKNRRLEEEVLYLKTKLSELRNPVCSRCLKSLKAPNPKPSEPRTAKSSSDIQKNGDNLVFFDDENGESGTQVPRRSQPRNKRRKKFVESSSQQQSQEQKKRKVDFAEDDTTVIREKPTKKDLLLEGESLNPTNSTPGKVLVYQTCETDIEGASCNRRNSFGRSFDGITVIPETVPMDFDDEELSGNDDVDGKVSDGEKVSDEGCLDKTGDTPENVRKLFSGTQTPGRTPNEKLVKDIERKDNCPVRNFEDWEDAKENISTLNLNKKVAPSTLSKSGESSANVHGYGAGGEVKSKQTISKLAKSKKSPVRFNFDNDCDSDLKLTERAPGSKSLTPSRQGHKSADTSSQFGFTQALAVLTESESQGDDFGEEGKDSNVSRGKVRVSPSTGAKRVSPGRKKVKSRSPNLEKKKSPVACKTLVSPVYKVRKSAFPSPCLFDDDFDENLPEGVSASPKLGKSPLISQGFRVASGSSGESPVILIVTNLKNVSGGTDSKDLRIENCDPVKSKKLSPENSKFQGKKSLPKSVSPVDSDEDSQSLVSAKSYPNHASRAKVNSLMPQEKSKNILTQSKSDSHLSVHEEAGNSPSDYKKRSSLPCTSLKVSQILNTVVENDVKTGADEVWLTAKKTEPKPAHKKAKDITILNTPSPKSLKTKGFHQQTIMMTLKKNTENDLSELEDFNGGIHKPDAKTPQVDDQFPDLSFDFRHQDDEVDENVPPVEIHVDEKRNTLKKKVSLDMTFDPDATCFPQSQVLHAEVADIHRTPFRLPEVELQTPQSDHDHDHDTSYSLLPNVKINGTIDPDIRLSEFQETVAPKLMESEFETNAETNDLHELPNENCKPRNRRGLLSEGITCQTESSEDIPFHSTCRSAVFGKDGNVSVGLPPNFSEFASEIPQDDLTSKGQRSHARAKRQSSRSRTKNLFESTEVSLLEPQSQFKSRRLTRKSKLKKSPENSNLSHDPEHPMEHLADSRRKQTNVEGSKVVRGNQNRQSGNQNFENSDRKISHPMALDDCDLLPGDSKSKKTQKLLQGAKICDRNTSNVYENSEGEHSYVFNRQSCILKPACNFDEEESRMNELCVSLKFGAGPKTFPKEHEEMQNDYLGDVMSQLPEYSNEAKYKEIIRKKAENEALGKDEECRDFGNEMPEEESQGLGDDHFDLVATPVVESEKEEATGRRRKRNVEKSLMDDSFDRVPQDEGPGYAYCKVERNKQKRAHCMQGHDCAGCKEYYEHLPEEERGKRMQETSRHRAYYVPPSTPPHFWSLKIPSTQSMKMKCMTEESPQVNEELTKTSPKKSPAKGKFRRRNKLKILPPKFNE